MNPSPSFPSRRRFLRTISALGAVSIVPGPVLGLNGAISPNEKMNIACIGIGGRGHDDIRGLAGENIVALCDVDSKRAAATFGEFPKAKQYKDFRRVFDEMEKEIDAVVVGTPDHVHAVAVMRALKADKHVYCEKPLAHTVHEVRAIQAEAARRKVTTQLGNQGHSTDSIRSFSEWIKAGAIGTVREVHAFCNSSYGRIDKLGALNEKHTPPDTLDWDLWLGPTKMRDYNPVFLPGSWRGWSQFGTGVIGDWTCHVVDPVFWALDLGAPTTIQASVFEFDPVRHFETFPKQTVVKYEFPEKSGRPAVKLTWYDGAQRPPKPPELGPDQTLPPIGALVVGDKGKIVYGSHGAGGVRLIPEERNSEYRSKRPARTIPRVPGDNHHLDWVQACKEGRQAGSNFAYGGALAEIALLGIVAIRFAGHQLVWDGAKGQFANPSAANQLLTKPYRAGWSL